MRIFNHNVSLRYTLRDNSLALDQLIQHAAVMKRALGWDAYSVGIWLCSDSSIRDLNRKYRSKPKSTDVLSFPFFEKGLPMLCACVVSPQASNLDNGVSSVSKAPRLTRQRNRLLHDSEFVPESLPVIYDSGPLTYDLGDIVVSIPYVKRYAMKHNVPLETRLRQILAHGICHLVGFRHDTDLEWERMKRAEQLALEAVDATSTTEGCSELRPESS